MRKKSDILYLQERRFVGKNFNVTRAGIHADGMLKNEEIYNIFDTDKFLKPSRTGVGFQYIRNSGDRILDQCVF